MIPDIMECVRFQINMSKKKNLCLFEIINYSFTLTSIERVIILKAFIHSTVRLIKKKYIKQREEHKHQM
mgnify:CR=1 FL=1